MKKGYGDNLLIGGLDFTLPRGGIVGVIGPNGAGKTTLFRMITGIEKPDAGTLKIGETVQIGYVDQSRDALDANKTVWEEISGGQDEIELGKRNVASRAYVSWFNFKGAAQQRKVGTLSGGERNRVHLAKLLKKGSNLLLLDEPTNDLDVDTLRALEEALLNFAGCAVRDQPRPVVPRSHRDAHARVRRQQRGGLVRRQLSGLRGGSQTSPWRGSGPAASNQVPEADAVRSRQVTVRRCRLVLAQGSVTPRHYLRMRNPQKQGSHMCRNIKTLFNFDPPRHRRGDSRARRFSSCGSSAAFTNPSKANEAAFDHAVDEVVGGRAQTDRLAGDDCRVRAIGKRSPPGPGPEPPNGSPATPD